MLCPSGRILWIFTLEGMRDRSMPSGMKLAREIQLTGWSTAGEQGKVVFVVLTKSSIIIYFTFHIGNKSSFDRPNQTPIQAFLFKISVKEKRRK